MELIETMLAGLEPLRSFNLCAEVTEKWFERR